MASEFFVRGTPAPKGSFRALQGPIFGKPCHVCKQGRRGHPRVFNDNPKTKIWEKAVKGAARASCKEKILGPVEVTIVFTLPRLKAHFRTGKHSNELRADAPFWHPKKADIDKLARATLDGLTDIAFEDDAKVARLIVEKVYGDKPGALIGITALSEPLPLLKER